MEGGPPSAKADDAGTPQVIRTRRLDNGAAETVEIVLDRPLPMNAVTRFTFNDGVAVNVIEYTLMPGPFDLEGFPLATGDTDGDGDVDLFDAAVFQTCFGVTPLTASCGALNFNRDDTVNLDDLGGFRLAGPGSLDLRQGF